MPRFPIVPTATLAVLSVSLVTFALMPPGDPSALVYTAVAALAIVAGLCAVRGYRPSRPIGWLLVLAGLGVWVIGDVVWWWENEVVESNFVPAASDAVYLAGYVLLGAGVVTMVRIRRSHRDQTALLDSLIVAVGLTVLVTTFVIAPVVADSSLSVLGKLTSAAYPVGDLLLLTILARLWTVPGARSPAYLLLSGSLALTLVVDLVWSMSVIATGEPSDAFGHGADTAWLASYVLAAGAALVSSMRSLAEAPPEPTAATSTQRRLILLAAGMALPAVALLTAGAFGGLDGQWPVIGVGMFVLTVLILARMSGLLLVVQSQAASLAAVARSDPLTGAPNRRTWDHELDRAATFSREHATPLCVAILDLDSFKSYNDTHGHQAGDRLLREAVAAWTESLGSDYLLARYGGEEFTVLLPGVRLPDAAHLIRELRAVTPSGQSFSAGVAQWDASTEPTTVLTWADGALYDAKRSGKDKVVTHRRGAHALDAAVLPPLRIVVQPIVDTASGRVVGHEALARFVDGATDVEKAFRRAHAQGHGDLLEAQAITSAMALPGRPAGHELYVNASPSALASPRFWSAVPTDLTGIVVEICEVPDGVDEDVLGVAVERLRERGARIALDDIGSRVGGRELARLASLHPDVVKVDRTLVVGCSSDPVRRAILHALVVYATSLGVSICAEGLEDPADLSVVRSLNVSHAQGYLLGAPSPRWMLEDSALGAPQPA